jgi:hypothetical protein
MSAIRTFNVKAGLPIIDEARRLMGWKYVGETGTLRYVFS